MGSVRLMIPATRKQRESRRVRFLATHSPGHARAFTDRPIYTRRVARSVGASPSQRLFFEEGAQTMTESVHQSPTTLAFRGSSPLIESSCVPQTHARCEKKVPKEEAAQMPSSTLLELFPEQVRRRPGRSTLSILAIVSARSAGTTNRHETGIPPDRQGQPLFFPTGHPGTCMQRGPP